MKHPHLFVIVLLLTVTGCAEKGPKMYPISGAVSFDGQPVVDGIIIFTPDSNKGNAGRQSSVVIKNGKYQSTPKNGVMAGFYFATLDGFAEPHPGTETDSRKAMFRDHTIEFEMPPKAHVQDFIITKGDLKK